MDIAHMLQVAATLLGLAALGGLLMLFIRFGQAKNPPTWLAMGHGMLAAAGITLLLYAACVGTVSSMVKIAIALLLAGAAGGALMNLRDHWNRILLTPSWVIGHMAIVVIGFAILAKEVWL
jgi:hypothetical protein